MSATAYQECILKVRIAKAEKLSDFFWNVIASGGWQSPVYLFDSTGELVSRMQSRRNNTFEFGVHKDPTGWIVSDGFNQQEVTP